MAEEYNSVPLGQAGTGSAFILGNSQSANRLINTIDYNNQIDQKNALLRQQQAQKLAADWQKNALKVDGGLYWQPEFDKRGQEILQEGMKLRSMGIDPYSYNPNPQASQIAQDYILKQKQFEQDMANRKLTEGEIKKRFDLIKGNPNKYYPEEVAQLNELVNKSYDEAKGSILPNLVERFNPNTVLSKVTPAQVGSEVVVGNKRIKSVKALPSETRDAIVSGYSNDPQTQRWVNSITGSDLTINQLEGLPNDTTGIKNELIKQYKGSPLIRERLAAQGITNADSEAFDNYINAETNKLASAKSKWENQIQSDLNILLPKVKEMSSILPDYSAENQADKRQARAQRNTRFAERGQEKSDDAAIYRQNQIDDIWDETNSASGVSNAVERLKSVAAANPLFRGTNVNTMIRDTGRWINISVPERKVAYTTTNAEGEEVQRYRKQDAYNVRIDKTNPQDKVKLNKVLDVITGEKISESKLQTGNAGGKVKGTIYTEQNQSIPKSVTTKFKNVPKGGF